MSEEKNALQVLDGTIEAIQNIIKVLNTAKEELIKLKKKKNRLKPINQN